MFLAIQEENRSHGGIGQVHVMRKKTLAGMGRFWPLLWGDLEIQPEGKFMDYCNHLPFPQH